jgi:RHS repeat-associated protein
MKTSLRAKALACTFLAGAAYAAFAAGAAQAQSAPTAPPPPYRNADANGVDLVTGRMTFSLTEAAIGSGAGGLSLARYWTGSGAFADNWSSGLYEDAAGVYHVQLGEFSDDFTWNGSAYVSVEGRGAALTDTGAGTFRYTAANGTTIDFLAEAQGYSCPGTTGSHCNRPGAITRPDGVKFTVNWTLVQKCAGGGSPVTCPSGDLVTYYRFKGVTSSAGYSFLVNYATSSAGNFTAPQTAWYQKTGVTFSNGAVACDASCPSITYTSSGGIETVTDALARTWRFDESTTQLTGIRRPGASSDTISISYGSGAVVTQVVNEGVTTTYARSVSGNTATTIVTSPAGQKVAIADRSIGRLTSIKDENLQTTSFQYGTSGRLAQVTAPEANYVTYLYDGRGNVTQTQAVAKDGTTTLTATASYPSSCSSTITCNKPSSVTDARGNTTDYNYDSTHGGVLTVTAPAPTSGATRPQVRYSYTLTASPLSGQPGAYLPTAVSTCQTASSCTGTSDEVKTTIAYDANFLPSSISQGAGDGSLTATSAMTHDPAGNVLTVDGPLSGSADTLRYRWDAARQLVGTVSADPDGAGAMKMHAVRNTYDSHGFLTKVEAGTVNSQSDADWAAFSSLQETDTAYDANGRPVTRSLVSGGTTYALTQTSYDSAGRPQCTATRMNPSAFGALPSDACTLGTAGSYGDDRIVKIGYDPAGAVNKVQSGYGVSGVQSDDVTTLYTNNGKVASVTDAEGNKTSYFYDGFDRLSQTQYPSGTKGSGSSNGADFEQLGYDANGNVTSRRLRDANSIGFTYDALNRPTYKDLPGSDPDTSFTYDLLGRLTGATQGTESVSFSWDALGRKLSETGLLGTVQSQWDAAGRRTRMIWPDATYVDYDYLVTGEVSGVRQNGATSGLNVLATYAYDDLGRRTGLTRGNGTSSAYSYTGPLLTHIAHDLAGTSYDVAIDLTYNPAGQIVTRTLSNDAYAYTAMGSGSLSYGTNGLNQVSSAGTTSISADLRGNTLTDGTNSYTFSSEDRMITLTGAPYGTSTLGYDPLGRWTRGGSSLWLGWDGGDLAVEKVGTFAMKWVLGAGGEPLVREPASGSWQWMYTDERGSPIAEANDSGVNEYVTTYDEYGRSPSNHNAWRYGYAGQIAIGSGLSFARNRVYSLNLGRFLQTDPIEYDGGMNLYGYVGADPVNFLDPEGLKKKKAPGVNDPIFVDGTRFGSGGGSSAGGGVSGSLGGGIARDSEDPTGANCGGSCAPVVITYYGGNEPFILVDGRYIRNPNWRKSPWSETVDVVTGIFFMGPLFIMGADEIGVWEGTEYTVGRVRVAPWGNRTSNPYGKFPHYHRPGTGPGQGIGRHRPWEPKVPDTSFFDRF